MATVLSDCWTITQAADYLGLSRQRVWQLIREGRLEASWIGSRWLVDDRELRRFAKVKRPSSLHTTRS